MVKTNFIIQSFWHGSELSTMELLCIESFINHGHAFHLYCYDEIKKIPEKCVLFDANKIVSQDKIFYDSKGGISGFANYFRIHLLFEKGGWWVDLDIVCLKTFDFSSEFCFSSENHPGQHIRYTNCCIKSPSKSEFLHDYIEIFDEIIKKYEIIPWLSTGPVLINELLRQYDSKNYIYAPDVFCPVNYFEIEKLICKGGTLPSKSYAVHLYNKMWQVNKLDKNKKYDQASIYEILKARYLNLK